MMLNRIGPAVKVPPSNRGPDRWGLAGTMGEHLTRSGLTKQQVWYPKVISP